MIAPHEEGLGRACGRWVDGVTAHARTVVLATLLATAAVAGLGLPHLGLDSDEDVLFADSLDFVPRRALWRELFPAFQDPILVVVDGSTPDAAEAAADALIQRISEEPDHFLRADLPERGEFFERNGLLYLDTGELEDFSDRLTELQPLLGELAHDPSMRGLFGVLGEAVERSGADDAEEMATAILRVATVLEEREQGHPAELSWNEWIGGHESPSRQLVRVQPVFDFEQLNPAGASIDALRRILEELGITEAQGGPARARMTGVYVLAQEESDHVSRQATIAGALSFLLVGVVLGFGVRSLRVVAASLVTLAVGLIATAGLAALMLGRLNLVSVAFAVLFIGLSIDFAIHLGLATLTARGEGLGAREALGRAAREVGGALVLCALTTAFGFFAFAPTDYRGVAELGIIAGTGMFVSLVANLTLLPALLTWFPPRPPVSGGLLGNLGELAALPIRHRGAVLTAMGVAGVAALTALPRVDFDVNPLHVRNPEQESVRALDDLLVGRRAVIWNMSATAADDEKARTLADRLGALESVDLTVTLPDFIPDEQQQRREIIDDLAFLLVPTLAVAPVAAPTPEERRASAQELSKRLRAAAPRLDGELAPAALALATALSSWLDAAAGARVDHSLEALDRALTRHLPAQLGRLRRALEPDQVSREMLPEEVLSEWVSTRGRVRVEVFPAEDLNDGDALGRYVDDVVRIAPDAYGEALTIHQAGLAVERSLAEALALAGAGIALLLLVLWRRRARDAGLVLLPLAVAAALTAACTVWIPLPLNFANVIVIPLLLGMGVDSGIHLVHRLRDGHLPSQGLLGTTTARAVSLSALTTVAAFGTLGLSEHPGLASLGRLLALGLGWILVSNLVLLPALAARKSDSGNELGTERRRV